MNHFEKVCRSKKEQDFLPILEQVQNITKIKDRPTAITNRQTQCKKANEGKSKGSKQIGTISIKMEMIKILQTLKHSPIQKHSLTTIVKMC